MTILIDTQVLVWLGEDNKRLGPEARRLLADTANQVLVSYFSLFEITIKASIGKMTYNDAIFDDLPKAGLQLLSADRQYLKNYRIFNTDNRDPFDNMLLTVAQVEQCAFMTSDEKILASAVKGIQLIDAKL